MSVPVLYSIAGIGLFCIALRAVIVAREPLRAILAFNVMSSGVFLVLVALARRVPGPEPDPVPHAMDDHEGVLEPLGVEERRGVGVLIR